MPDIAIINGEMMPLAEAMIPVTDLGFLRGCGAFETLRTYDGNPHLLHEHMQRLWRTAAVMGIEPLISEAELLASIRAGHQASGYADVRVNLVCTPGDLTGGVFGHASPRLVVLLAELVQPPQAAYDEGIHMISWRGSRPLPEHKTTNYLCGWQALAAAKEHGAAEACYVDADGMAHEGVTSNIIIVRGDEVFSPADNCLGGLTRNGIQQQVTQRGLTWHDQTLPLHECYAADEIWIASTIRELLAIVRFDDHTIGAGTPGPLYREISLSYAQQCRNEAAACN